jgi:C-terminal processing protease CtpA/Prc
MTPFRISLPRSFSSRADHSSMSSARSGFRWSRLRAAFISVITILTVLILPGRAFVGQKNFSRDDAEHILEVLKDDIRKNYYDPDFHGIDLDARFKIAKDKLKTASSGGQMMAIIAQVLLDFDDSHLFFIPPGHSNQMDYGWEMQAIGDRVLVSAVEPKSDAAAKGLKEGDEVVSVGGFEPARDNLWKIQYFFRGLSPKSTMHLVVKSPDGKQRELDVNSKVLTGSQLKKMDFNDIAREVAQANRYRRSRWVELGPDVFVWKLPTFAIDESDVDAMAGRARKYKTVILDLRGNSGGYVTICERLAGSVLDHEVTMAQPKGRKTIKPMKAQKVDNPYKGRLIVLIDSDSASASEVFARVIQIEKRGAILGDRSAGAVMEAIEYPHELGIDRFIPYASSVTYADLIMTDGKSLEKTGVVPDELILPTAADLLAKRDPVLARAAALAGVQLTGEKAGALFPVEWRQ